MANAFGPYSSRGGTASRSRRLGWNRKGRLDMSEDTEARPSLPDEPTEPSSPLLSPLLDADSPAPRGWPAAAIWTTIILVVLCLSAVAILALGLVGSKQSDDSQGGLAGIFRRTYGEPSSSREARGQLTELARKDLTTALEHADDGDFSLARDATERAKALLSVVKTLKPKDTPPEVGPESRVCGGGPEGHGLGAVRGSVQGVSALHPIDSVDGGAPRAWSPACWRSTRFWTRRSCTPTTLLLPNSANGSPNWLN